MLILKYGEWFLESREYENHSKLNGKFYLILYKDAGRTPQHIDYPIIYADKSVAYDINTHKIPQTLRRKIVRLAEKGLLSCAENREMTIPVINNSQQVLFHRVKTCLEEFNVD